jgi:threonine dehydratase
MSNVSEMEIFFKKDFLQYTGSFKERGARFALMSLTDVSIMNNFYIILVLFSN